MGRAKGSKETKPRKNSPSEAEALRRLEVMNMRPLEPYPGNTELLWRYACKECGREQQRPLKKWKGFGCKVCAKKVPRERIEAALSSSLLELDGVHSSAHRVPVKCSRCLKTFELDIFQYLEGTRVAPCRNCQAREPSRKEILSRVERAGFRATQGLPKRVAELFPFECATCGRVQLRSINSFDAGKRCKYCAGAYVDPEDAYRLFRSKGLRPLVPYPGGARARWLSECEVCGEQPSPSYTSLAIGQSSGCGFCSGKEVNPTSATKVMRENGFEPLVPYPGSLKPWKSKCLTCGKTPTPSYSSVKDGKRCIFCFPGGIDFNLPGHLYLITNVELEAHKFGIQTFNSPRLASHVRRGWDLQFLFLFQNGEEAHAVEQQVKRWIREDLGIARGAEKSDMPVGGHTETLPMEAIEIAEIAKQVLVFASNDSFTVEVLEG